MAIESVMPSNHLVLCRPLLLLPSIFPSISIFSGESAICIRSPEYWSFKKGSIRNLEISELNLLHDGQTHIGLYFSKFFSLIQFLKVTFHLQLLQNKALTIFPMSYNTSLKPVLHLIVSSHSPTPVMPLLLPFPHWEPPVSPLQLSLLLFSYIHWFAEFFRFHI